MSSSRGGAGVALTEASSLSLPASVSVPCSSAALSSSPCDLCSCSFVLMSCSGRLGRGLHVERGLLRGEDPEERRWEFLGDFVDEDRARSRLWAALRSSVSADTLLVSSLITLSSSF